MLRRLIALSALALCACGTAEPDGTALAGPSCGPVPLATTATAPPAVRNTAASATTICDAAGGWELDVPSGWYERRGHQHGRDLLSYDPTGMDNDGNVPPSGGVLVHLQMVPNPDRLDPAAFARLPTSGVNERVLDHQTVTLAGQRAEFYSVRGSQPVGSGMPETTLVWQVRSPFFDDRMVVITAAPAGAGRIESERIVKSLRFFQPAPLVLVPALTRADAIARVRSHWPSLGNAVAKLVLRKEVDAAIMGGGREYWTDPDALTWLVAYTGTGIYVPIIGPAYFPGAVPRPTPQPCRWGIDVFPADGDWGSATMRCGPESTWPAWFDRLVDRGT